MTALAADRDTSRKYGENFEFGVKAATVIYAGSLVALDANGLAVPGATATTLKAVGRAEARADNSGGADNAISADVRRGVFSFGNSAAADEIALSDVGATCYIVDDQTVAKTDGSSSRSAAGIIRDVDALGVWVEI